MHFGIGLFVLVSVAPIGRNLVVTASSICNLDNLGILSRVMV